MSVPKPTESLLREAFLPYKRELQLKQLDLSIFLLQTSPGKTVMCSCLFILTTIGKTKL